MTTEIVVTPDWEGVCEWFARALAEHAFEQHATAPVVSFIEQVRFLALTDPAALERVRDGLTETNANDVADHGNSPPSIIETPQVSTQAGRTSA